MRVFSSKKMADILDVTERRIRQLRDDKIIEEFAPGQYEPISTVRRYIRFLKKGAAGEDSAVDFVKERALLMRVKRQSEEYDLALKEGKMHETSELTQILKTLLMNFRSRLMAIPSSAADTLARKTDKSEIYKYLKREIDEALEELADFDVMFAEAEESQNDGT